MNGKLNQAVSTQSPMNEAMNQLSQAHSRVAEQVERSLSLFHPVLRPEPPSAVGKEDTVTESPLVDTLKSAARYMEQQADILRSFNERCTL